MADKTWCPGCDATLSSIRVAFDSGAPCPNCGLSASAAAGVTAARERNADAKLTENYRRASVRAEVAESRVMVLEECLRDVARALRIALPDAAAPADSSVLDRDSLVSWLQEQAEDDDLEQALVRGSLDSSPASALISELIRRARE